VKGRLAIGGLVAALALAGTAYGARTDLGSDVSANWAGYVITGAYTSYTSVTGTWKQPQITCTASDGGASSAFWVGLGGYYTSSQSLEQIGTSADCSAAGKATYYAWYELVPQGSVTISDFPVSAGDVITTSVNVVGDGSSVLLQLKNRTTRKTFTKTLPFASVDSSSAEWVAEAPSACNQYRCRQLSLSNFGSVQFTKVAALGNSIGGTLTSNAGWTSTAISLVPTQRAGFFPGPDRFSTAASSPAGATTSAPTTDGRGFTVSWAPGPATS
jgi:hypothetical protein